ncbi:MAG: hypothetical protein LAT55_04080 [Opitutales bacterium]|nr:hypothetical protein [Opitutales bacterium]
MIRLFRKDSFYDRRRRLRLGVDPRSNPRSRRRNGLPGLLLASFLSDRGFRRRTENRFEKRIRRRRAMAMATIFVLSLAFAWVIMESAKALEIF